MDLINKHPGTFLILWCVIYCMLRYCFPEKVAEMVFIYASIICIGGYLILSGIKKDD